MRNPGDDFLQSLRRLWAEGDRTPEVALALGVEMQRRGVEGGDWHALAGEVFLAAPLEHGEARTEAGLRRLWQGAVYRDPSKSYDYRDWRGAPFYSMRTPLRLTDPVYLWALERNKILNWGTDRLLEEWVREGGALVIDGAVGGASFYWPLFFATGQVRSSLYVHGCATSAEAEWFELEVAFHLSGSNERSFWSESNLASLSGVDRQDGTTQPSVRVVLYDDLAAYQTALGEVQRYWRNRQGW